MYTDDNGIVRFEALDNIAPLQVNLNAALESVSDSLTDTNERIDVLEEDTGWVNLTLKNGWVSISQPRVRKRDGIVYLEGEIRGTNTGSANPFTTLPSEFRRTSRARYPAAWGGRLGDGAFIGLETNGDMFTTASFSSSPGLFLDVVSPYFAG